MAAPNENRPARPTSGNGLAVRGNDVFAAPSLLEVEALVLSDWAEVLLAAWSGVVVPAVELIEPEVVLGFVV